MRLIFIVCTAVWLLSFSDAANAQAQHGFRITFADKRGTKDFSDPTSLLTQRSLDRRSRQGIALDSTDLPVSPVYIDSVLKLTGGKMHLTSRWFNQCVILLYDSTQILQLQGQAFVTGIDYIAYYSAGLHMRTGEEAPDDKYSEETKGAALKIQMRTTGSEAFYGSSWGQTHMVNGEYLHDRGFMGQNKLIAVLDEGFTAVNTNEAFDSLTRSGRLVDKRNFALASDNVFTGGYHGTSSLSTIAAYMPGTYVGSAPLAQYALYITEYAGEQPIEMDNMVAAMERADSIGADIITASLGYNEFFLPVVYKFKYQDIDGHTMLAARGANMATRKGILFVASAGNEGGRTEWPYILTPGDADSAITVGNVDPNQVPASNSGWGPNAAGKVKPDVCMLGNPAMIIDFDATPRPGNGTSFATPQLAGWAACLWQTVSTGTPYKIRTAIIQSASHYNTPTDKQLGYDIPNFGKAIDYLDIKDTPRLPKDWVWASNPSTGSELLVRLDQTHTGNVSIRITDIAGRVVYREDRKMIVGMHTLALPAAGLSPGMYFFNILSDGRQKTIRFIKN